MYCLFVMSKGEKYFNLFGKYANGLFIITYILFLVFTLVILISVFYLIITNNNSEILSVINASLVTILVLINLAYTAFTYQIVNESKTSRKITRAEKSLEQLYIPFRYFLKTHDFETDGDGYYFAYPSTPEFKNVYQLEDIVQFLHLASEKHKQSYIDFIDLLVQIKQTSDIDISNFKEYPNEIKNNVEEDISELEDELNNLTY